MSANLCSDCGKELPNKDAICSCGGLVRPSKSSTKQVEEKINQTYEIIEVAGKGSFGIIYKAKDILQERIVALKMVHSALIEEKENIQRLQNEARAVSAVNHPNVITAYDFGVSEKCVPYIVLDYLDGESLAGLIARSGPIPHARCVDIFAQVTDAMHIAHTKGILHRNLKPSKIMLVESRGNPDFVKIIGFGYAKILAHSGKVAQDLTQEGDLFGTPLYMSPEQYLDKGADERSDVYAIGCSMYESLTGRVPFPEAHILENMQHLEEKAPSFSSVNPELKVPDKLEKLQNNGIHEKMVSSNQKT